MVEIKGSGVHSGEQSRATEPQKLLGGGSVSTEGHGGHWKSMGKGTKVEAFLAQRRSRTPPAILE